MSSIINKVKEAVTHDKHEKPSHSTNAGPHDSNMANKVDPRVDSDRDGRAQQTYGTTGTTGTTGMNTGMNTGNTYTQNEYGTGSTNAGPHNSNVANKIDPRVDSDLDGRATHHNTGYNTTGATTGAATGGYGTGATGYANNGPHNSKIMNKMDPRVDSDREISDGRNAFGPASTADTTTKSFEQSQNESTATSTTAHGAGSTNHGPHNSNLMNKLDPRVDSDRDHRATHSGMTGHSTGTTGVTMGAGAGGMGAGSMGTSTTGHHGHGMGAGTTTTAGPHGSNLANKMDPRVDSDRSTYGFTGQHGTTSGTGMTGTGMTGHNYNTRSTNAGPHDSNMANKMDPRVDSDMDNRARHQHMGTTGAPAGSSYASTGAGQTGGVGPHNSNLLNKLDPRVDSDLDGSRTVGNTQRRY
ncbi:hypothetical protein ZTR_01476 [Talaromyces verruculosus]|nr:hypothetical protein ZTR_01476 [Talaromyces verruculosus]